MSLRRHTLKHAQELQIPYDLHVHERDPQTAMAPNDLKAINPYGTAPYFRDTKVSPPVALSESGAIVEYILTVYGSSGAVRLTRSPGDKDYGEYLQFLHFANGSLQPALGLDMLLPVLGMGAGNPVVDVFKARTLRALKTLDDRLAGNKYLAGEELSAADIMSVFSLSTMRGFCPAMDLGPYPNILRYLKDVAARPAYQAANKKGDHGMQPLIGAKVKGFTQFAAFAKAPSDE